MYEIILKTWHQVPHDKRYDEVYHNLGFANLELAVRYLNDNFETIVDEFPFDGELTIKYNERRI